MVLKKCFFFFACCLSVCWARAQGPGCNLTLRGVVRSADTANIPFGDVTVFLPATGRRVIPDGKGRFSIDSLCRGPLRITLSYVGYRTIDTTLPFNGKIAYRFLLVDQSQELQGVTVTAQRLKKDELSIVVSDSVGGKALQEIRGLSLGESLKSIAGVNSLQTGPSISKPVIHGVYSNRILILNNGVRQEGQNWGNDHAPEIDPFIATKLSVIKGAASIRYGSDAIGGVVLVDPKDLPALPGTVDGEVNAVGMTNGRIGAASAMVEGAPGSKTLEGLSWRLQGTLKKAGNARAPTYYLGNTGYVEGDYSATVQYTKSHFGGQLYFSDFNTKIGIATASVVGSEADLYQAFARSIPSDSAHFTYDIARPYQTVDHKLLKTSGWLDLGPAGKLEATYAWQRNVRKEYDADVSYNNRGNADNIPDLDFELNTQTVDLLWEHAPIAGKLNGSIGLNLITHGNYEQGTSYYQLIPNFVDYGGGLFAIEKYETGKWLFEAGARYDYRWLRAYALNPNYPTEELRPTYDWKNSTFNVGVQYKFSGRFSALYNFGTAWRPPQVIELFANGIHQSAASWEIGDSSLTQEQACNNNLSFTYSTSGLVAEIGSYVNYFHHYIYLKPDLSTVQTATGAFPAFTYTQVNALFEGLDLSVTYNFAPHFSLISKSSIVRAHNETIHNWLVFIPADRTDNSIRYTWDSIGRVRNFHIGVGNLAVAEQTRVPPNSDYTPPPAGYDLWAADAGCSLPWGKKGIDVNLSATNLTNASYRDYLNRFRYYMNDLGRNVVLRVTVPL
ncbi:MAG TPA: TonB-dependent receptor plug domain-containing protein [Puia sp.]|nr:TonB-dependent receptor plug domain-containing protein [Puia sp.]